MILTECSVQLLPQQNLILNIINKDESILKNKAQPIR